jgi:hypothetical protein
LIELSVERGGKTIVLRLFTTDMTSTPEALATLYGRRWSVEGDIKSVKQTLGIARLSCRSVEMAEKEIPLAMVAYNLVIQVRRLAARRARVELRQLSFRTQLASGSGLFQWAGVRKGTTAGEPTIREATGGSSSVLSAASQEFTLVR